MAENSRIENQLRDMLGEDVEVKNAQSRIEDLIQRLKASGGSGGGGGSGSGIDGISPTVEVTTITGGHRVSITDVNGTETFDILDGTTGTDGTTFTPSVSNAGVISWTNDGNKQNPASVDLVAAVIAELPTWTGGSY